MFNLGKVVKLPLNRFKFLARKKQFHTCRLRPYETRCVHLKFPELRVYLTGGRSV